MTRSTGSHISDQGLVEAYFDARLHTNHPPHVVDHLAACAACARRFEELSRTLDGAKRTADLELDAAFPPERLRVQRQQVLRQLESVGRTARILTFPLPDQERRRLTKRPKTVPRWVAAAAVAGLAAGVGINVLLGTSGRRTRVPTQHNEALGLLASPASPVIRTHEVEDAFLLEVDHAADGPRMPELEALDALTPHFVDAATITSVC